MSQAKNLNFDFFTFLKPSATSFLECCLNYVHYLIVINIDGFESSIESHHSDKPVEESPLKKIFDTVCDRMNTGPKKSLDDIFEEVLGEAGVKALSSKVECIEVLCSEECVSRDCNIIPYDVVQELSSRFQSMSSNKIHGYLLERLTLQKEMGFDSETVFILKGHRFCKGSLKSYFGISEYMVKTVRRELNNGQIKLIHGNKGNLYFSEDRSTVISFIQILPKCTVRIFQINIVFNSQVILISKQYMNCIVSGLGLLTKSSVKDSFMKFSTSFLEVRDERIVKCLELYFSLIIHTLFALLALRLMI